MRPIYIGELYSKILSGHPLTVGGDLIEFAKDMKTAGFTDVEISLEIGWEASEGDHLEVWATPPSDELYARYADSERGGDLWRYLA